MEKPPEIKSSSTSDVNKNHLFEVPSLSRLIKLVLFVSLPFVGFILGLAYNFEIPNGTFSPYGSALQMYEDQVTIPNQDEVKRKEDNEKKRIELNELSATMDAIRMSIQRVIQTDATSVTQCKAIGFGSRACGGPNTFLIYSDLNTDVELLEGLVSLYNHQGDLYNQKLGAASICVVEQEPEVALRDGQCVGVGQGYE